mgnify:FL=1
MPRTLAPRLIPLSIACAIALAAGCAGGFPDGVIYPSITPQSGQPRLVTHEFTFEGAPVTIDVVVDGGLYAGAAAAAKTVTRFGNARENDWIEDYYPAFVDEEHQEAFYANVLAAFRNVRTERSLDADRYAELLVVFVQSLTYETDPVDLLPKYPVETFVEGVGDCDDKSLLLAALLSREGYSVSVLLFEPEQHVALGIRSAGDGYASSGYDFIETTAPAFVGMVPDSFAGGITLESDPRVIPIGSGDVRFGAADQVDAILEARTRALASAEDLAAEIRAADAALATLEGEVTSERARLDGLRNSGQTSAYNASVDAYNALVAEYNTAIAERNALAGQYNALSEIDRLVVNGLDDRTGTYARVVTGSR